MLSSKIILTACVVFVLFISLLLLFIFLIYKHEHSKKISGSKNSQGNSDSLTDFEKIASETEFRENSWIWLSVPGANGNTVYANSISIDSETGVITATFGTGNSAVVYKITRSGNIVISATKNGTALGLNELFEITFLNSMPLVSECSIYRCKSDLELCDVNTCISDNTCEDVSKQEKCFELGQYAINKAKRICASNRCIDSLGNFQKLNYIESEFLEHCTLGSPAPKPCEGDLVFVQVLSDLNTVTPTTSYLDAGIDYIPADYPGIDPYNNIIYTAPQKRKKFRVAKSSSNSAYNFSIYDRKSASYVFPNIDSNSNFNFQKSNLTIRDKIDTKIFFQNSIKNPSPLLCTFDFLSVFTLGKINSIGPGISGNAADALAFLKCVYYAWHTYIIPLGINFAKNPKIYIDPAFTNGYSLTQIPPEDQEDINDYIAFNNLFDTSVPAAWPDRSLYSDVTIAELSLFFAETSNARIDLVKGFYEKFSHAPIKDKVFVETFADAFDRTLFFREFMVEKINNVSPENAQYSVSADISAFETKYLNSIFASNFKELKYTMSWQLSLPAFENNGNFHVFMKSFIGFLVTTNFANPQVSGWTDEQLFQLYYNFVKTTTVMPESTSKSLMLYIGKSKTEITTWPQFYKNEADIYTVKMKDNRFFVRPSKITPVLNFEKDDFTLNFVTH